MGDRLQFGANEDGTFKWNTIQAKDIKKGEAHGEHGNIRKGTGLFSYKVTVEGEKVDKNSVIKAHNREIDVLNQYRADGQKLKKLDKAKFFGGPSNDDVRTAVKDLYAAKILHKTERDTALESLKNNPAGFLHLEEGFKNDEAFIKDALGVNGLILEHLTETQRNTESFVRAAVSQNGNAIQYASAVFKNNNGIVDAAIAKSPEALALLNMQQVIRIVSQDGLKLQHASDNDKDTNEVVHPAVTQNGMALQFASEEQQVDRETVLKAYDQKPESLQFAGRNLVAGLVSGDTSRFQYAHKDHRNDLDIVRDVTDQDMSLLQFAGKDAVLARVREDGTRISSASADHQKDYDIVKAAYDKNHSSIANIQDKDVIRRLVQEYGLNAVQYLHPNHRIDQDILHHAFTADPKQLKNQDVNFVKMMVELDSRRLADASKEAVRAIVSVNGMMLEHASQADQNDSEIVRAAFAKDKGSLQFAGKDAAAKIIEEQGFDALQYAHINHQQDLMQIAFRHDPDMLKKMNTGDVIRFLSTNGMALQLAGDIHQNNINVVRAAYENKKESLQFAKTERVIELIQEKKEAFQFAGDKHRDNPAVARAAFNEDPNSLKLAGKNAVIALVTEDGRKFMQASEQHKNDIDVLLPAYAKYPHALRSAGKEATIALVSQNGRALLDASDAFQKDIDVVRAAFNNDPRSLLSVDPETMLAFVKENPKAFEFANAEYRNDPVIVNRALMISDETLPFATREAQLTVVGDQFNLNMANPLTINHLFTRNKLFQDESFAVAFYERQPETIRYAPHRIAVMIMHKYPNKIEQLSETAKNTLQVVEASYAGYKDALHFAGRDAMVELVKKQPLALQDAPEKYKKDPAIVLEATYEDILSLHFADKEAVISLLKEGQVLFSDVNEEQRNTLEVVEAAYEGQAESLKFAGKEATIAFLKKNPMALEHAADAFKNDYDIVGVAFSEKKESFQFAGLEVVKRVIQSQPKALQYARNEVVLEIVKGDGMKLGDASKTHQDNPDIVYAAVKNNTSASQFMSDRLMRDDAFMDSLRS